MNDIKKLALLLKDVKVLYVEDDLKVREVNSEIFSYLTNQLILASDGEEALEKYNIYKPHIIITDIKIPKLNGIEFIKNVREKDKKTPVVFCTAYSDECYLLPAANLNIQGYLVKPLVYNKLKEVLFEIIKYLNINSIIEIKISDDLSYDTDKGVLIFENTTIDLNKKEKALIDLLVENKNKVVLYQEIENSVWGIDDEYMSDTALRTLIKILRKKLPSGTIENIARQGYKIITS
ncbi:MAG: response regulator transcription factor [Campylobacterota bacterium]|nr:response regulator transcription factor [Campylobacterota bacterium]